MIDIDTLLQANGLFVTTLPTGQSFTWRLLTIKEYHVFYALRQSNLYPINILNEEIFNHCYLGKVNLIDGNLPAGIFPSIGGLIMTLSGDNLLHNTVEHLKQIRSGYDANNVLEAIKLKILKAFPSYKPIELSAMTYTELLNQFNMAEAYLERYENIPHLEIGPRKKQNSGPDMRRENEDLKKTLKGGPSTEDDPIKFSQQLERARKLEQYSNRR